MGRQRCSMCSRSAENVAGLVNACNEVACPMVGGPMSMDRPTAAEFVASLDEAMDDPTNPSHYRQGGIECIDAIEAATVELTGEEAYCTGCAIKYLWRWKRKGGVEDLRKARWYLDRLIK